MIPWTLAGTLSVVVEFPQGVIGGSVSSSADIHWNCSEGNQDVIEICGGLSPENNLVAKIIRNGSMMMLVDTNLQCQVTTNFPLRAAQRTPA